MGRGGGGWKRKKVSKRLGKTNQHRSESKRISAEVSQSAAAGLLWLSGGEGDHHQCDSLVLVVLSVGFCFCFVLNTELKVARFTSTINHWIGQRRQEFILDHNSADTGGYKSVLPRRYHHGRYHLSQCTSSAAFYQLDSDPSDVVEQATVKEGLDGAYWPNIVLVFPSLDEGDEPGGVQMRGVVILR